MPEITDDDIIQSLLEIKGKSDESFEKNISLIAAGTLVLSLTFIEKIVSLNDSGWIWCLITSWCLLAITLLANLVSHQISSRLHGRTIEDFRNHNKNTLKNVGKRNFVITSINWITSISLILGIGFLILFCSLNANKANNQPKKEEIKICIMPRENDPIRPQVIEPDQQKGMPINIPRGPSPQPIQPQPQPASPPQQNPTPNK